MSLSLLATVSPGQKPGGRGPGGGAGNTRPAGGRFYKRSAARARPGQGATRKTQKKGPRPRRSSAWINRLLVLAGAAIVTIAASQAYITVKAIPVKHVTVTGDLENIQREAVQDMVQPALRGGFLGADLAAIRSQLESMPWIFEANVRRKWPAALEIHVVEQLPIARWGEDGFLNHEGGIFRSSRSAEWQELPLLRGPEGAARSLMATYRRMVDMLSPIGLRIEQLAMDERGQVQAELSTGTLLLLGGDDFLARMHRFTGLYQRELAVRSAEVDRVDMRYATGAAVSFSDPAQVAGL